MNGSEVIKAVIDINVIFMALYNKDSKAGKIIELANQNKLQLFSPDSVKEEIIRVLKRELNYSEQEINFTLEILPINWIEKQIYEKAISKTKVLHKSDKPVEGVSLIIGCGILSANKHFKDRLNIDDFLKKFE